MIAAYPVAAFILLAFGISYLLGLPLLVFASGAVPPDAPLLLRVYLPRLLIVFGPGLSALVVARAAGPGAGRLISRAIPTRRDLSLAAAIVAVGFLTASAGLVVAGVTAAESWTTVRDHPGLLFGHFVVQVLIVAIGEELGWRGWLLPALAARTTRVRATLLTALVWTLWHGPRLLDGPAVVATFTLSVFGLSFLFTWIWSRARHGLFPVIVAHAVVNTPVFFWEHASATRADVVPRLWTSQHAVYTAMAVTLVMVAWRWWMAHEPGLEPSVRIHSAPPTGQSRSVS